jgi:hypothetical protein
MKKHIHEQTTGQSLDSLDERDQCQLVKDNLDNLALISNPSEKVQIEAVRTHRRALKVLLERGITPSLKVMEWAFRRGIPQTLALLLSYDVSIPDTLQTDIVNQEPSYLEYFPLASRDTVMAAISRDPYMIRHVHDSDEDMQLAAVKQDGDCLEYIVGHGIEPSKRVKMAAINSTGKAIRWLKNPSYDEKKAAVMRSWFALECIPDADESLEIIAVERNYRAIKYIAHPSERVQKIAIKHNAFDTVYRLLESNKHLYDSAASLAVNLDHDLLRALVIDEKLIPSMNIIEATLDLPNGDHLVYDILNDRRLRSDVTRALLEFALSHHQ